MRNPADWVRLYYRSRAALRYGARAAIPGLDFARFGRRLGWRLLVHGRTMGGRYLLTPVNSVRYFEFDFALACLPDDPRRCLDLSSPRLFSLYVAAKYRSSKVTLLNPSHADLADSQVAIANLGLNNVDLQPWAADALRSSSGEYDCIWSLSVVEHIAGAYDDRDVVRWLYSALKPGGKLILTVPVDRRYWTEYRDSDQYGTQTRTDMGKYFFQRFYDASALRERLIEPIGSEPVVTRWFGEKVPGHFQSYVARWMRDGGAVTVEDPRDIADNYRPFDTWDTMPGVGVAGLLFEKPR